MGSILYILLAFTSNYFELCNAIYGTPNPKENTTSMFLNRLLEGYDWRIRPNFNGKSVLVNISLQIGSIGHIAETTMDYRVTIFLRQMWNDPRIAFNQFNETVTLDVSMLPKIWVPDIFIVNEKLANFHSVTKENKLLRLKPNGDILLSMRLSLTLSCNMKLHRFPMDKQTCRIELESYAYTKKDIVFNWVEKNPLSLEKSVELPQFTIVSYNTNVCKRDYITGSYPCVEALIHLQRQTGYYFIQTYIPTFLIVCLSWISFWIDANTATARVGLGITTVLTMTTQTSSAQESLPRVSYIKAIDVWMAVCLLFVFLALLEFSAVNFLSTRKDAIKKEKKKRPFANAVYKNHIEELMKDGIEDDAFDVCQLPSKESLISVTPEVSPSDAMKDMPSRIDNFSRILFPFAFALFNAYYWTHFLILYRDK